MCESNVVFSEDDLMQLQFDQLAGLMGGIEKVRSWLDGVRDDEEVAQAKLKKLGLLLLATNQGLCFLKEQFYCRHSSD